MKLEIKDKKFDKHPSFSNWKKYKVVLQDEVKDEQGKVIQEEIIVIVNWAEDVEHAYRRALAFYNEHLKNELLKKVQVVI